MVSTSVKICDLRVRGGHKNNSKHCYGGYF